MENNNEEFDWQKEVMPETVKRIQRDHERQKELAEVLKNYKLKKQKDIVRATAFGVIGAAAACGLAISFYERHTNPPTTPDITYDVDDNIELIRYYTVEFGDSITSISRETGIPKDKIQSDNGIENINQIYIDQNLQLIYSVSPDDLEYYTDTISVDEHSIYEIAGEYDTSAFTLYKLNGDNIISNPDGTFEIAGNTIVVPNFITPQELEEVKGHQK